MIKKILSIIMAVIMAFSVAQIAFAADGAVYDKKTGSYTEKQFVYYIEEYYDDDFYEDIWLYDYIGTDDVIYIPKTLGGYDLTPDYLDAWVFENSDASAFSVDADNEYFSVKDGVLFSKDGTELIAYPNGKAGDSYDIPEGVETLDDECFFYSSLKEVTFPSTLAYIGYNAFGDFFADFFEQTDGLIYAGNNLVGYADNYIKDTVTVKDGTEKILNYAFPYWSEFVVIPDSVKEIGEEQEYFGYICGNEGSYAQKFAEENDVLFVVMGENHKHMYVRTVIVEPTCVTEGKLGYWCPCGDEKFTTAIEADKKNGHRYVEDSSGELVCKYCGEVKPHECTCRCHKVAYSMIPSFTDFWDLIANLFFKLKVVIWHLTGTHQYCECGARHY